MSYEAHVTDTAYCYDGSFAGFLCCVFESYARKEIPAEVCPPEEGQLNFFGTRQIFTDEQHARRVDHHAAACQKPYPRGRSARAAQNPGNIPCAGA